MISEGAAWAIFLLPLFSFLIIALIVRPFFNRHSRWAGYVTILAIAASFVLSLWALRSTTGHEGAIGWDPHPWMALGSLQLRIGILMDPLTAIMVVVVSGVSLMVQVYSQGYMAGDPGYARYFAFMSLFTAAMLGLVLASNVIQLYLFWEMVGLCSYLLIGFWYHRPAAAAAAKKAFLVTRLGDVGFLLAILYLFFHQGLFAAKGLNSLEIPAIHEAVKAGILGSAALTWLAIGIFAGAAGKSAQFPLHVWLPDAMEGPTPVSSLIHAATMVAAGVFLVARFFPVFQASTAAMNLVAVIGGFTALMAASMGLVMRDIKRVIAYSTISQLGYMMLALGVGAYSAAMFHLFNHAFFKCLLFLGAGSANHASGTFDMRYMGGLRKHQPWTYATFLVAALSLAGIFPLAGFWSKDEVLAAALVKGTPVGLLVFILALSAVFMTAFYIFRVLFLTWHGEFRGGAEAEARDAAEAHPAAPASHASPPSQRGVPGHGGHGAVRLAESPAVMVIPMVVLGLLAVASGALANPPTALASIPAHWFGSFVVPPEAAEEGPRFTLWLAVLSTLIALAGIGLAYLVYAARRVRPEAVTVRPLYQMISRKYFMDDLYEGMLTGRLFYGAACGVLDWFDRSVVDGVADTVGWFGQNVGRGLARLQTGQLQAYGAAITIGVAAIVIAYLLWG